ncbi:MAG: 50S ribosomal protein L19 [Leptospiraceae bacterium]|nr:50S ribosomal protein L19 [Leptospiraceae bacterium]
MIHPQIDKLHLELVNRPLNFRVGDTVKVHYKIVEGNKERIQVYEGLVIAINNRVAGKSFTVRRISYDVGVERVFPVYAPTIDKIEVVRSSKIRRGKLYYLRSKIGKDGRLKEIKKVPPVDKIFEKASALPKKETAPAAVETEASAE